jgi:starch phosphorylase
VLDPRALTIGFARRFATYKRADLFLRDMDRMAAIINDETRPVQFIFSGKAHPADEPGKQLIKRIANLRHDPRFAGRVIFVEDYDINVSRHLVQGVDVWLNNPRRPLEASGTSGQKVVLNGGLNWSVLDGWWAEAFNGVNGFAIGKGFQHVDDELNDSRDAEDLLEVLQQRIIPLFYDRDMDGLPRLWIDRMMNSIATLAPRFSAHRMVMDYVKKAYLVAAGGLSSDMNVR